MRLWGHWFERGGFHCASVGVKPLSRGLECFRKGRCDVWWMWSEVRKSVKRRDCFVNSTLEFFGSFVVEKQLYWLCGGGMLIEGVNDLPVKFSPRVGTSPITLVPDSTYQVFCQWRSGTCLFLGLAGYVFCLSIYFMFFIFHFSWELHVFRFQSWYWCCLCLVFMYSFSERCERVQWLSP